MNTDYSWNAIYAFFIFILAFIGMTALLYLLNQQGIKCFYNFSDDKGDILHLLTTLPFVALYLVVLIGATAGYARSAIVAEKLPIAKLFEKEMQKRTMNGMSIKSKVRSGGQIKEDTTLADVLNNLLSSRLSINALVDDKNKVIGVITARDVMRWLSEEMKKDPDKPLKERLSEIKISALKPRKDVIVAESGEDFHKVAQKMISNQFNKLIVVESEASMKFVGTVDMIDLVGELFEDKEA